MYESKGFQLEVPILSPFTILAAPEFSLSRFCLTIVLCIGICHKEEKRKKQNKTKH